MLYFWVTTLGRPRACGGAPSTAPATLTLLVSAPRLRGCSAAPDLGVGRAAVGPAPAGVLPASGRREWGRAGRPHACGGAPSSATSSPLFIALDPRLRGCSPGRRQEPRAGPVGPAPAGVLRVVENAVHVDVRRPAPAGVLRAPRRTTWRTCCRPRARGGATPFPWRTASGSQRSARPTGSRPPGRPRIATARQGKPRAWGSVVGGGVGRVAGPAGPLSGQFVVRGGPEPFGASPDHVDLPAPPAVELEFFHHFSINSFG